MLARRIFVADGGHLAIAMALAAHLILPAFGQADGGGGDAPLRRRKPAMRAGPRADIIAIAPIDQIVAAFRARMRMVGDFIGGQPGRFSQLLGGLVETGGQIILRDHQRAGFLQQGIGRVGLDGELIEREMAGVEGQRLFQFGAPGGVALPGAGIDEIERDATKMRRRQLQRRQRFGFVVQSPQRFQRIIVQRLHPQRDAVHPRRRIIGEPGGVGRGWIGFQGDLGIVRHRPELGDARQDAPRRAARHQRGGAAAEEHAFDRAGLVRRRPAQFG
jgi:hypothetical protein